MIHVGVDPMLPWSNASRTLRHGHWSGPRSKVSLSQVMLFVSQGHPAFQVIEPALTIPCTMPFADNEIHTYSAINTSSAVTRSRT